MVSNCVICSTNSLVNLSLTHSLMKHTCLPAQIQYFDNAHTKISHFDTYLKSVIVPIGLTPPHNANIDVFHERCANLLDPMCTHVISLVTSRFDYCNGLLCGIPEELICKLQRVQNNAARVITLTEKHDHITPVLEVLHWLPVRKRIEFKILLLAYKCLHGTAPSYLREMLKEYVPTRTLRSTSKNLLCEPRTNMKTYDDRPFNACAPKLCNQLPNIIRAAWSVATFKRQLKTHMFKDVFIE